MNLVNLYVLISIPFGWATLSKIQKGFVIFGAIDQYIIMKFILSFCIGWAVTPFYMLAFIFKIIKFLFFNKKKDVSANE